MCLFVTRKVSIAFLSGLALLMRYPVPWMLPLTGCRDVVPSGFVTLISRT
jgi:hypothetical protein